METPTPHILVVEDHDDTRIVTATMLRRNGYVVRTAANLAEAEKLYSDESFDLLLCDIGLSDGSGLDLMRKISVAGKTKGIAYTAYGYEKDIASALDAGFSVHLLKPVDLKKMLETVKEVLKESPTHSTNSPFQAD